MLSRRLSFPRREIYRSCLRTFEAIWFKKHGPPNEISIGLKLSITSFREEIAYFSFPFNRAQIIHFNRLISAEKKHAVGRALCLWLMQYAKDLNLEIAAELSNVTGTEIVFRFTYSSNILWGNKAIYSFEIARGYISAILELWKCSVSENLMKAFQEQKHWKTFEEVK